MISKYFHIKLTHCLVIIFLFISFILGAFYINKYQKDPNLEVLILNKNTSPVFTLNSQITYSSDLVEKINQSISHSNVTSLNLLVYLDSTNINTLESDLKLLNSQFDSIYVSIIGKNNTSNKTYLKDFLNLSQKLSTLNHVNLICYPPSLHNLSLFNTSKIKYIGTVLKNEAELSNYKKIYSTFKKKKILIIMDAIPLTFGTNADEGAKQISKIYYSLAIHYPEVTTIFSPYVRNAFNISNSFYLERKSTNFNFYNKIYSQLLNEPWLASDSQINFSTCNMSPYSKLSPYTILNGTEELLLRDRSYIIPGKKIFRKGTISYIRYRWNEKAFTPQSYYPYLLSIDTTTLPNGINRLKGIAYSDAQQIITVNSIDLKIDNSNIPKRAQRSAQSFSISKTDSHNLNYIPILMYHTISPTVSKDNQNSWVQTDRFDAQMKALKDNGYETITFKDLDDFMNNKIQLPDKPVIITMDDGYLNNYTIAYPIYKKYNLCATLFVSPAFMQDKNTDSHFGWDAAREMENSGLIDIQSHGYNHIPFTKLPAYDLRYHISYAKGLIEQHLGKRDVFVVACPQFRNHFFTRSILKSEGVQYQITKLATPGTVLIPDNLKRINVPNTMTPNELISTLNSLAISK